MMWIYENPSIVGWYATLHSWDSDEGSFPDAHYYNGEFWAIWHDGPHRMTATNLPIIARSPYAFDNEKEAEAWAYEHDPEVDWSS